MSTGRFARLAAALLLLAVPSGAFAYLKIGVDTPSGVVLFKWKTLPVRYFVSSGTLVPGVTANQLQTVVGESFDAWTTVPNVTLSSQFIGFVQTNPSAGGNSSVLGFEPHPEADRVLGQTSWVFDTSGNPVASHIWLNTTFAWTVATPAEVNKFDVRSIATHEIGHLLGLSHSAIGETTLQPSGGRTILGKAAVMFPIAYPPSNGANAGNTLDRTLKADDIAGISDIYGTPAFRQQFGQITGKVTLNGAGIFGAHLFAFSQKTGAIIGGFSLDNTGTFVIGGLEPGLYLVRAEPLDDADLDSFFDTTSTVNINFKATYYSKLVAVPAGGAGPAIEIKVSPK